MPGAGYDIEIVLGYFGDIGQFLGEGKTAVTHRPIGQKHISSILVVMFVMLLELRR